MFPPTGRTESSLVVNRDFLHGMFMKDLGKFSSYEVSINNQSETFSSYYPISSSLMLSHLAESFCFRPPRYKSGLLCVPLWGRSTGQST